MNFFRNILAAESRQDEPSYDHPEMDAAIAEMKERLERLRNQRRRREEEHRLEREVLEATYLGIDERLRDRMQVDSLIKHAPLTVYMAATKQVRDYIVPGVVASLQAQLCLHVHALCVHNEQLVRKKQDASELIWWYEDMVRQLQRDQADQELTLMNELVQTKILLGQLVDEKKLRERREERLPLEKTFSKNAGGTRGRFSRTISRTTTGGSTIPVVGCIPRRMISSNSTASSAGISHRRGSLLKPQQRGSISPTISTGNRLRVVRSVSRRGTAIRATMSAGGDGSGIIRSVSTMTPRKSPMMATLDENTDNVSTVDDEDDSEDPCMDHSWNTISPNLHHTSTSKNKGKNVRKVKSDLGDMRIQPRKQAISEVMSMSETIPEGDGEGQEKEPRSSSSRSKTSNNSGNDTNRKRGDRRNDSSSSASSPKPVDIHARRAARAKARAERLESASEGAGTETAAQPSRPSTGSRRSGRLDNSTKGKLDHQTSRSRPMLRGVERTRSKSLTSEDRERGGRRKDQSPTTATKEPRRAVDDSQVVTTAERRVSLLRGFAPAPDLIAAADKSSDDEGQGITATFRNWMGNISVKIQQSPLPRQQQGHSTTWVG